MSSSEPESTCLSVASTWTNSSVERFQSNIEQQPSASFNSSWKMFHYWMGGPIEQFFTFSSTHTLDTIIATVEWSELACLLLKSRLASLHAFDRRVHFCDFGIIFNHTLEWINVAHNWCLNDTFSWFSCFHFSSCHELSQMSSRRVSADWTFTQRGY